ncbi:MAG: hypothetical protein RIR62_1034 [Pseudomonadota bacterium]|jgi:hypothetical protein
MGRREKTEMAMRAGFVIVASFGLLACSPPVPDSAAGVGFQDYGSYLREQQAAAARGQTVPGSTTMALPAGSQPQGFSPDLAAAAIDRATGGVPVTGQPAFSTLPGAAPLQPVQTFPQAQTGAVIPSAPLQPPVQQTGALDPNRPRGNAPANIQTQTGELAHMGGGVAPGATPGTSISDEQDFDAVAARETIESDAARIERNRQQYTVIQPTALPERTETGPNIVQYALQTTHNPGTQVHSRSALRFTDPQAACARYASPDLAQQAFLEAGGPERDRRGLDPDGDGFACSWDPRPFRLQ